MFESITSDLNIWFALPLYAICSYVAISFGELLFHQNLMHGKFLPRSVYKLWPYVLEIYEAHAIRHHGRWYRQFNFEPDPEGRLDNINIRPLETFWIVTLFFPVVALFFWISPILGFLFVGMTILHDRLWNLLHTEMHLPRYGLLSQTPIYRWLARYHYMHHQFTNKNYNVVCPLADYLVGTHTKPRLRDLRQMLYLGYLVPRRDRISAKVASHRTQAQAQQTLLLASSSHR